MTYSCYVDIASYRLSAFLVWDKTVSIFQLAYSIGQSGLLRWWLFAISDHEYVFVTMRRYDLHIVLM